MFSFHIFFLANTPSANVNRKKTKQINRKKFRFCAKKIYVLFFFVLCSQISSVTSQICFRRMESFFCCGLMTLDDSQPGFHDSVRFWWMLQMKWRRINHTGDGLDALDRGGHVEQFLCGKVRGNNRMTSLVAWSDAWLMKWRKLRAFKTWSPLQDLRREFWKDIFQTTAKETVPEVGLLSKPTSSPHKQWVIWQ